MSRPTHSNGVLSTNSVSKISAGYPHGAVVELVADESGRPLISVSTLSLHTSDLQASSKCSITVTAQSFKDMSDARVTLTGDMVPVPEGECAAARELYLAKHPDAFYIDFGDFSFYRMDNVVVAHLNGGFARFSQVLPPPSPNLNRRSLLLLQQLCESDPALRVRGRDFHEAPCR